MTAMFHLRCELGCIVILMSYILQGKVESCLKGHKKAVCDVSYHPSEHILVSASFDGSCKVWTK